MALLDIDDLTRCSRGAEQIGLTTEKRGNLKDIGDSGILKDMRPLFTGSLNECKRFAGLHLEKELKSRRNKRRRDKPQAKIYRVWARVLAANSA